MGFADIKGQDRAIKILKNSIRTNHLAHAYLFVGQSGIGKKTTALALAQSINCLNFNDFSGDSCNNCISCKKIMSGNQPDVKIIKPDGRSIKIDRVRSLRSEIFFKCYESKFKVIIFDEAHFLTIEAANSLLKVLEEPPENTVFILVTSEPQQLPDTIISRCQQVQFQSLNSEVIKGIFFQKYPNRRGQIGLLASLARGSLSKTEELLQDKELMEKRSEIIKLLKKIISVSFGEISLWCEKWDKDRQNVKIILEMIQLWYRDLLVWGTTKEEALLINQDYLIDIKNNQHTLTNINKVLLLTQKSLRALEYNANPRLVLEVSLMKIKLN